MTAASCRLLNACVADKVDLPHRGLAAFGHLIDEIDAVVAAVDDFRHDADIVAPDMAVGFHDAADVGLYHGALQGAARLGFDDGLEFLVLYLLVAFESDASSTFASVRCTTSRSPA